MIPDGMGPLRCYGNGILAASAESGWLPSPRVLLRDGELSEEQRSHELSLSQSRVPSLPTSVSFPAKWIFIHYWAHRVVGRISTIAGALSHYMLVILNETIKAPAIII